MNAIRLAVFALLAGAIAVNAGCSPFNLLNATVPDDGYVLTSNIAYGDNERHTLDIYVPEGLQGSAKVVVFFYGGSWKRGVKSNYRFVGQALASRGLVTVIPDYRLHPEGLFPGFIEDGARALRWVKDNIAQYGGDDAAIYLSGHSAGAHIAAMLTLNEDYLAAESLGLDVIKGFVGISGPYAFNPAFPSIKDVFAHLSDREQARPINFVDGDEPPMLLMHGGDDETVAPFNSTDLAAKVNQLGGQAQFLSYPDIGHFKAVLAFAPTFRDDAAILDDLVAYIQAH